MTSSLDGTSRIGKLAGDVRASEWWTYKIAPILASAYATAVVLEVSPASLWPTLLLLLMALVALAAFASLINDICDLEEDRLGGKPNKLDGMPRRRLAALFGACSLSGIAATAWLLRYSPVTASVYVANWLVFVLYSIPPIRLKHRALLGVVAIALGEALLPHMLTVFVTAAAVSRQPPTVWAALVAVWSFAVGLRSILWHQLRDHEADRRAGVETLAVRWSPRLVERAGLWIVFPIELAVFLGILCELDLTVAWALLGVYAATESARRGLLNVTAVVVRPAPGDRLVMFEFYDLFYPIASIAGSLSRDPANWILLFVVVSSTGRARWWAHEVRRIATASIGLITRCFRVNW